MTVRSRPRLWQRVSIWIGPAIWLAIVGLTARGAIDVWAAGGLPLLFGCFAWSFALWSAFFWLLLRNKPLSFSYSKLQTKAFVFLMLFVTALCPGIATGVKWGLGPGTGVALLGLSALMCFTVLSLLVNLPKTRRFRRLRHEMAQFEAKFDAGPIGVWRADLPPFGIEVEPGCQVVFQEDGRGHVLEWKTMVERSKASPRNFTWKPIDNSLIEVKWNGELPATEVVHYHFRALRQELSLVARMVLFRKEALDSLAPAPECAWLGMFFIAYQGEPPDAMAH
jgi:hypothetical protein